MRILAFSTTHDSSVCSLLNGKIEYFSKEERLTRVKRDNRPFKCLDEYESLKLGKIDHILYCTPANDEIDIESIFKTYIRKKFNKEMENFSSLLHHKCHASLAYFNSKFKESLVFVIDRNGSYYFINEQPVARESESVYIANNDGINPILKNFFLKLNKESEKTFILKSLKNYYNNCEVFANNSLSIVKVYEAATTLIGQNPLENGKTMGLSSYGDLDNTQKLFIDGVADCNKFSFLVDEATRTYDNVCFYNCENLISKNINKDNYKFYADKAKLVQSETQKQILQLIKKYVEITGIKNVCIVGGYGLNVVANNYYLENLPDINFYFEPVADDTGISIGAAMLKYKQETTKNPVPCVDNFYHYYAPEKLKIGKKSSLEEVCNLLKNKKSVAIFEGNPEVGPRALGHRSILFDARNIGSREIVNNIKRREWYRPFAGVIMKSYLNEYFEKLSIDESAYMTVNFKCKSNLKIQFPGIVHVDGTCRIQTVEKGTLYDILNLFNKKNNCPILLNTSFNLSGEPLVHTIEDAIKTWKNSFLDAVYFVDYNKLLIK